MAIRKSGKKAKIGIIQVDHIMSQGIEEKQKQLIELAEKCFMQDADLVFFPEAFQYTSCREIVNNRTWLAEENDKWKNRCSELARKYNAYVVPWDYEPNPDGKVYNSSYILDREGKEIGRYRKCQLTYSETVIRGLGRGREMPVFDLDFGKVGIMICFDNYFPETARSLGIQGAELVLYPLYGDTLTPQWETKLKARAIDNCMYIASSQIDMNCLNTNKAYSGLVDPYGNTLCHLTGRNSFSVVEIEMGRQVLTRSSGPEEDLRRYLDKSRNPDAYAVITKPVHDTWDWNDIYDANELPN